MGPLFTQATKETLAKRSGYLCSNPDCRALTAGPTADPASSANIGEAAHIFGAKLGSARYRSDMTDGARAEITNGIWLCRNCHKLVDTDAARYSPDTLFSWRKLHDVFVADKLGNRTDQINALRQIENGQAFETESPLSQRIIRDQLPFWEFRLTAEALRHHLAKPLREWSDLSSGLYIRKRTTLEEMQMFSWISEKSSEAVDIIDALCRLCTDELKRSWGEPGVPGDPREIVHVCKRIADVVAAAVQWEEEVKFLNPPTEFTALVNMFQGTLGRNIERIIRISQGLDDGVDWAEEHPDEPRVINLDLVIDLPPNWAENASAELTRITRNLGIDIDL